MNSRLQISRVIPLQPLQGARDDGEKSGIRHAERLQDGRLRVCAAWGRARAPMKPRAEAKTGRCPTQTRARNSPNGRPGIEPSMAGGRERPGLNVVGFERIQFSWRHRKFTCGPEAWTAPVAGAGRSVRDSRISRKRVGGCQSSRGVPSSGSSSRSSRRRVPGGLLRSECDQNGENPLVGLRYLMT